MSSINVLLIILPFFAAYKSKTFISKNIVKITDRKSAIEYALTIAKPNDIVAILGKGAEKYQEIKGTKVQFSDYEVVDNFFKYSLKREIKT